MARVLIFDFSLPMELIYSLVITDFNFIRSMFYYLIEMKFKVWCLIVRSVWNLESGSWLLTNKVLCSKILSLIVSFFTSTYVTKWRAFFPQNDLKYAPSFRARVISCASMEVLQAYLLWRQYECKLSLVAISVLLYMIHLRSYNAWMHLYTLRNCHWSSRLQKLYVCCSGLAMHKLRSIILLTGHINNQYDTCLWQLIKSGKTKEEAEDTLKVKSRLFWLAA